MNSKYKYLIKNMGILTLSNFSSKILVFLLVPLYTSVLSTTEYGIYDLVVSTIQLIFPIISANIVDAVMRFSMDKRYDTKDIASIGIKYLFGGEVVVAIFLIVTSKFELINIISNLEVYIFFYYTFYTFNQFLIQFAKGLEKVTDMGIAGILSTVIMVSANILFLLVLKIGLKGFFVANILAQLLPTTYLIFRLKIWKYVKIKKVADSMEKEMLIYSLPLIFSTVGWWVNNAANKYFVTFFIGLAAYGILSVSYKIPSIINTIQSIFIQAWQISAIKEYESKEKKQFYGFSFYYLNFLMCVCCALLILLSKPLASVLYAKDFYIAWRYVPILLIASVVNAASGFLGPILSAEKNSRDMAKSAIYGMIANIVFNILLVYVIGMQGATIATLASSCIIYISRKKSVAKQMDIPNEWKIYLCWSILIVQAIVEILSISIIAEIVIIIVLLGINVKDLKVLLMKGRKIK